MKMHAQAPKWMKLADQVYDQNREKAKELKNKIKNQQQQHIAPTVNGVPNPDTDVGRAKMINKFEIAAKDVLLRARIIEKIVNKAIDANNRKDFKEELVLLTEQTTKLKANDVPAVVEALLTMVEQYEKSQGRTMDLKKFKNEEA